LYDSASPPEGLFVFPVLINSSSAIALHCDERKKLQTRDQGQMGKPYSKIYFESADFLLLREPVLAQLGWLGL
jgi:hypothetical protein